MNTITPNILENTPLKTDSYKINHWNQYPKGTEAVYSYFESRKGAKFPVTPFFGLQAILQKYFVGVKVTTEMIDQAEALMEKHFGNKSYFNRKGWEHIVQVHGGRLPLRIKAVREGTPVPTGNVLMTVENTDPQCFWLTNWAETVLTHVWYPSTVAALSRATKGVIRRYMELTCDTLDMLNFKLHDFGYRGTECDESAQIGGAAHLLNFLGTDTIAGMVFAMYYYNASPDGLAYSVAATKHSIMTALGPNEGEEQVLDSLLTEYPNGILSVVSDSYDIENFVRNLVCKKFKERILARNGIFVVRPDSTRGDLDTPQAQMVDLAWLLWEGFGGTTNTKGFKVINPKIRLLWGDGIDTDGIGAILEALQTDGFSTDNVACFGMGGGLLQKVNRDTQRFAFKSCAQKRNGVWYDIYKQPKDSSKVSKKGRMKLVASGNTVKTVPITEPGEDLLEVVFENGYLTRFMNFAEVRKNSETKTVEEMYQ